ncbi:hypothetical protein [Pseudooceanicola onchidii]|uniref:hypothetical protein n=1 Tax=Pseudooceanicola onchidii TaxID=2562279 RepID=UPI0010AAD4D7|nr:hypothetical protein [Pseudooceanicola onchidii]
MKKTIAALTIAFSAAGLAAQADDVEDTLKSALSAYQDGDLQYALEELDYARQLMLTMKTDVLSGFLPAAPEGWTREINSEINASLGMMGGGVGAEAEYSGDGESFTLSILADNPMVGAMGAMIGNAAAMGMKVERVGREKFAVQDGTVQGLIDNRILVKAEGGEVEQMLDLLKQIDYRELSRFGN